MINNIYRLEFNIFFRSKAAWVGILILLISGAGGLYFGKEFIAEQRIVIEKAGKLQEQHIAKNLKYHGKDLGLLLFYNKFVIANTPDNWAAFANGQRDINPYLLSVTILGLEGQRYDTDLNNPTTLLLGNMDMAFVIVFLFPLVIIAFTYNLLSAEQESGVWGLVRSQSPVPVQIIWRKLVVRIVIIFGVLLVLLGSAVIYLQLALDLRFILVGLLISLYLLFWFSLSFWVISRGKSSNHNAVSLIAFWVVLNIISPALLNVWLTQQYPVPEALENVVKQREGYHEKWDLDKSVTMDKFYAHYPQFKKYPFPSDLTFSWYWYYAMQQMGDDEAGASAGRMAEKLHQRQNFTQISTLLLPGIQAQLGLNGLAGSDLQNQLDFQRAVSIYHEKLRLQFYPAIFSGGTAENIDWKQFHPEYYSSYTTATVVQHILSITIIALALWGYGLYNFRRKTSLL